MFEEKLAVHPVSPLAKQVAWPQASLCGGEPAFGRDPSSTSCACPSGCSWERRPSSGQFSSPALGPPAPCSCCLPVQ